MSASPYAQHNLEIAKCLAAMPPHRPLSDSDLPPAILQIFCPDGRMTTSVCAKIMKFSEKEKLVSIKCDLTKLKVRPDDKRVYLIVKRKPISSNNYVGLIEKLYDHFYGINNSTLETFFKIWMEWRATQTSTSEKTMKEDRFLWNAYLKDTEISRIPLKELTAQTFIEYFRTITKGRELTRKRFNNLKSILNGMMYLAVEKDIISSNCLRDINYRQFPYKSENHTVHPYTAEERLQIIHHLSGNTDDFYSLAICLDFHLVLRIGELKGLKWSDIHKDSISIQRFVNNKNQVIDDIKGHAGEGKRSMPLTPTARKILDHLRTLNGDSEYIFFQNGRPLTTGTFNHRLEKCCRELGIEYRPSHKIRFTTASLMYKNGMEDTELQKLLGHTTLTMTHHYLKNLSTEEETASKMAQILG